MNKIKNIFQTVYSKFVAAIIIFLLLIAGNVLAARVIEVNNQRKGVTEPTPVVEDVDQASDEEATENLDEMFMDDGFPELTAEENQMMDEVSDPDSVESVTYESIEGGENAFELLQENADVIYEEYDFGVFIKTIDGVTGNDKYFWAFYVNGEQAQAGADQTTLEKGDKVEWRYEKIIF